MAEEQLENAVWKQIQGTIIRKTEAKQHLEIIFINFQDSQVEGGAPITFIAGENLVSQTFFIRGK